MPRSKLLLGLAGLLIVVSVAAGWIAIGHLAAAAKSGIARTEVALISARGLAADTAESATELERVLGLVGNGLGSTSDALVATRQVSSNVRRFLDIASFVNSVDDLSASLERAETTIANVEVDLDEASGAIEEAGPGLAETVDSLQAIPAQLDLSIAEIKASATEIGDPVVVWRLAIVPGGAALLLLLALIGNIRRAVEATQP